MSLLSIIDAVDNFKPTALSTHKFVPFYLSLEHTQPQDIIGQIAPEVVHTIISHPPGTFAVQIIDSSGGMSRASDSTRPPSVAQVKAIAFDDRLSTAEERSEAIERASMEWREQGLFAGVIGGRQWRNERYTVYVHPFRNAGLGGEVAFELERSACQLFGFVTYGVHMTMYTSDYRIWVPRRSRTKQTWPGFLDNSVAGGIPVGMSPFESMVKECEEEASLTEDVARKHLKSVGAVSYFFQNSRGNLQPEVEYVYDMLCPSANDPAFVPKPLDGEVESFELMNWEAVIEKMKAGEFKRNSALATQQRLGVAMGFKLLAQVGLARILDACWDIQGLLMSRRDRRKDRVLNYGTAPNPPLTTTTCATLNLWSVKMPPRRTKKPVKTKPSSPRSSELESEVPSKYFTSKIASKVKSIVGLETDDTKPVVNNKKRKRTNAATEHDREDEEPVPRQQLPRKPRTKVSVPMTLTPQQLAAKQARISKATENDSESSESEDELATAPVSPTKPRPRGRPKRATAAPPKPKPKPASTRTRQSASTNTKVSSTSSARKTRKSRDEYDSSIRELTHSSNSPTPSETSDTRGSADYDPELEVSADYQQDEDEEEAALEAMEVDSDALDDESDFGPHRIAERASSVGKRAKKDATSEEEYQSDESGAIIVGKVAQAPETGRVPEGQISQNTFDFLLNLQDPEKNDREWFRLHEPVYRLAEKEWVAFVDAWVTTLVEVDDQIPPLPPKDIIHRIYRDRESMADHISIKPGGGSLVAAGVWCPGKNELQTIRNVIQRNHARRLREIIAKPSFVKYFGAPEPLATKGKERQRQSIFGAEDELKVAPAGVKKDHPNGIDEMDCTLSRDIDLLKCRSFAVIHRFTDAQVLKKDFLEKILKPVLVEVRPFVHCLNDYMTLSPDEASVPGSSSSSDEE
ncbi:hypothetical protein RhiXN_11104 [Rhizoctonia solani]|uniref:Nudix hydrolase domain-containing protein n=1 Tax=Rhizoctonia solani TaxID=456999 RepID=A0A8H8P9P1_9AGAM|nr:uncharacterized protein RhiXN_11104 [Rhizoctonia solani]QRW26027.1 hypothetical protein RhiXN_11104 [Rhizoctonia solani]